MVLMVWVLASSYFLWTLSQNTTYNDAIRQKNELESEHLSENVNVYDTQYSVGSGGLVNVTAQLQNAGPLAIQFITFWICVSNATWTNYNFTSLSNANVQAGAFFQFNSTVIVPGVNATLTYNFASWLMTAKGNAVALQKTTLTSNIIVSQTTQGIGALMMDFQNFTSYNVTGNNPPYFLNPYPNGGSGYSLYGATGQHAQVAFRLILTNLDANQMDITLYSSSVFFSVFPWSGPQPRGSYWYIVNVDGTGKIAQNYTPVVLKYNVAMTVYFASAQAISGSQQFQPIGSQFSGTAPVNLALIGTLGSSPFGQNIPFVSIYINS